VTVAAVGVRGRGQHLLGVFAARPDVDIKSICDIDEKILGERTEEVAADMGRRPEMIRDFRRALDDPAIDAIVVATPTHWHAIMMVMACQAGKDVYLEKPDGHNTVEGQRMVAAARNHQRVVQLGIQSRSGPYFHNMIEYIRSGHLGRALFAKAWESNKQGSIGHPPDGDPPAGVDYDMWLGPAPKRSFNRMRFHGNWRWFFDYGAGDLGNDGVHRLDLARWAFEAAVAANGDPPLGPIQAVSAHGAKCYFDDMQEWPDNLMITYDYGVGRVMTYEMRLWTPYTLDGEGEGAAVYGDQGYIVIGNERWRAFTSRNKLVKEENGDYQANTIPHVENFIECIRSREKPAGDLESVGHPSSLLCHLGNAAWRAGRTIRFDADTYTCIGDDDANQFLTRPSYRAPWTLPEMAQL
jgi:predicted dehydrogenase